LGYIAENYHQEKEASLHRIYRYTYLQFSSLTRANKWFWII